MIDEPMQEQAALHVLGALNPLEAREFKAAMSSDPELQEFVARLSVATGALAGSVPGVKPPPALRAKILAHCQPAPANVISLPARKIHWLPWALAACLAVLCGVLAYHENQQARRIAQFEQLSHSLQTATNELQQVVLKLKESNRLANVKIAMLNSLVADQPKTVAVTLWDDQRQDGVFVAQNLKPLPPDKDYELWVMDEGKTPVAAGVFHTDASGKMRIDFKPVKNIKSAGQFVVTMENKGGVASPTLKNMVLASN